MVRTALAAGNAALAERLVDDLEPRYPLDEHALCAGRAQLADHAGDLTEAATLYAEAAAEHFRQSIVRLAEEPPEEPVERLQPDLFIADIGLPDADGRDLCQALRARVPVGS
jgi:CheY-like chemotaxis protein